MTLRNSWHSSRGSIGGVCVCVHAVCVRAVCVCVGGVGECIVGENYFRQRSNMEMTICIVADVGKPSPPLCVSLAEASTQCGVSPR